MTLNEIGSRAKEVSRVLGTLGSKMCIRDSRSEVERLGVAVLLSCRVEKIEPAAGGGHVRYNCLLYTSG